jgi:hypothetical protein
LDAQIADAGARVEQVADNVYVILHDDATDEWPHGNTGVIVGRSGVFVRVEAQVREGRTLDQIQAGLELDDLRAAVPSWNGPEVSAEDWAFIRTTLIERAWRGVRGQG